MTNYPKRPSNISHEADTYLQRIQSLCVCFRLLYILEFRYLDLDELASCCLILRQ